jgi:eukaryotic-like serine/threonine-protein kinase
MSTLLGESLGGHYEVLSVIGRGGMGEVYKAHDSRLRRDVAIKVSREQFTQRFEREARVVASLNHPNICSVFDVGPNYLVMELIDGETLADRIQQGPIPFEEAVRMAGQIAEALREAHDKGVTHRDLKPGNIKIRRDGTIKVLDFGLAKVGGIPGATLDSPTFTLDGTQAGTILGTAAYMSPEQARGKPIDKRSDIYAFGAVVYEILVGEQLHRGESLSETLADVIKQQPDLARVPYEVRRLLASCLKKDPQQRLHEIADWKLLLDEPRAESRATASAWSRWGWPSLAGVSLVAALGLGVAYWKKAPPVAQEVRLQMPKPDGLTFNPGTQAAISPDSRWLSFAAVGPDGAARYYLRNLDSLDVRPLPGSEGIIPLAPPPFWSHDSRFVVYGAQGKLKKNGIDGTPAQTIADTGVPFVQGGSWSQENTIIYAKNSGPLMQVSANGGVPQPVTKLSKGESAHRWVQFLPDGRRFLYLRFAGSPDTAGIYVGTLDVKPEDQSRTRLTPANRQAWWVRSPVNGKTYLIMQRGEALLAQPFDTETATLSGSPEPIAAGVGGYSAATAGLWTVARNGDLTYRSGGAGQPRLVWRGPTGDELGIAAESGAYATPTVSPDGKRVAYALTDQQGNEDIWVADLVQGGAIRLTFDSRPDNNPVWSPDGTRIVFAAIRGGSLDLYEKNANGSGEERRLLASDEDKIPTSWSRDGNLIAFISRGATGSDLWLLPTAAGSEPSLFLRTEFEEVSAVISPDGRWIAYAANQNGGFEVYVRPAQTGANPDSGARWMVSAGGGIQPQWDDKHLYYVGLNGALNAVDLLAGPTFQFRSPKRLFEGVAPNAWALDRINGRFLFMMTESLTSQPPPITIVLNWMSRLNQ